MSEGNSQFESTHFAGDYRLGKVEIFTSSGKKIDISTLIVEMNIYESIHRSNIEGNLMIGDSHNHIDNLPIIGQEQISFKLHRPGINMESIDFETHRGRIYKVDRIVKLRERQKTYLVHFTTGGPWFAKWKPRGVTEGRYAVKWCEDARWLQMKGIIPREKDYLIQ